MPDPTPTDATAEWFKTITGTALTDPEKGTLRGLLDSASTEQGAKADSALQTGDIVDDLTTGGSAAPASGETVKTLKGLIDAINALLASDEVSLDELQEVVDFIQANRADLDALGIANIAGLQNALDAKAADTVIPDYLDPLTQVSSAAIAFDFAGRSQGQISTALDTNTTITLSNLTDGQTVNVVGQQDATGGRAVTVAHAGLTVRGDTSPIAGAAADQYFSVTAHRFGSELLVTASLY